MVERAQEEYCVGILVLVMQRAGIALGHARKRIIRLPCGGLACLRHVSWNRVDEIDFVAFAGELARVPAGSTADVKDHPRWRSQESLDQLLHADELEQPFALREPVGFVKAFIVREHLPVVR